MFAPEDHGNTQPRRAGPPPYDLILHDLVVYDGTGAAPVEGDLAVRGDRIAAFGPPGTLGEAESHRSCAGAALAPGFIDSHTHDDTAVVDHPAMAPKVSQGVTTVVVGNCGISAAPLTLSGPVPDPLNLLGDAGRFRYPRFADYVAAVDAARPAVNVVALAGHTTLRVATLPDLRRPASETELSAMGELLREAMAAGAVGLSTGLAYGNAGAAGEEEVGALVEVLAEGGGVYTTHMRTEFDGILDAMAEAGRAGRRGGVPVVLSHLKCAGAANWGRSAEVLQAFDRMREKGPVGADCYPYAAGSSTLDLSQVTEDFDIAITWSDPHPEVAGRTLAEIAALWGTTLLEAATRLKPAGAVYHNMDESDVRRVLSHPSTMIGSDGLPEDPRPHPRLWGAFPRVLGRYSRDLGLFPMEEAIRKMTSLTASRFGLTDRGVIRPGAAADLVLFDPAGLEDRATFTESIRPCAGILGVWVNGVLTWDPSGPRLPEGGGAGRFLPRRGRVRW